MCSIYLNYTFIEILYGPFKNPFDVNVADDYI